MGIAKKLFLVGLLPLLALIFASGLGFYLLIANQGLVSDYMAYYQRRQLLLTEIYSQLGYGKGVHAFKNYIVRHDPEYKRTAENYLAQAVMLIEQYRMLPKLSTQEDETMSILSATINHYWKNLSVAEKLITEGAPIKKIDEAVRIDDTPAVQAISKLHNEFLYAEMRSAEQLHTRQQQIVFPITALFIGCLIVSVIVNQLISKKIVRSTNRLSRLAERIANGEHFISIDEATTNLREPELQKLASDLVKVGRSLGTTLLSVQRSNRDLEQFAFIAAHDLQEPVKKIAMLSDLLAAEYEDQLDEEGQEYLGKIQQSAKRMGALNEALLSYARLNKNGPEMQPSKVDLNKVVSDCVCDLQCRIRDCDVELEIAHLPTVKGNEPMLRSLFQNLTSNSLKFQPKDQKGTVKISAKRHKENTWEIAVEDNGIGFDMDDVNTVLKPFGRLNSRSQYEGTGIGLANCAKILELHKSSFDIASQKGKGSRFAFTLSDV